MNVRKVSHKVNDSQSHLFYLAFLGRFLYPTDLMFRSDIRIFNRYIYACIRVLKETSVMKRYKELHSLVKEWSLIFLCFKKNWQNFHGINIYIFVICAVRLLLVLFYALFVCKCVLPLADSPTAVNKYIIINCRQWHS
jgi:hypothetical protein